MSQPAGQSTVSALRSKEPVQQEVARHGDVRLLNRKQAQERVLELLEAENRHVAEIGRLHAENAALRAASETRYRIGAEP